MIKDLAFLQKPVVLFGLNVVTVKLSKRVIDRAQKQVNKRPEFWLKSQHTDENFAFTYLQSDLREIKSPWTF